MSATHAAAPILADMGIPMIFVELPAMVCLLIPVIIIEALLLRRWVPLSYRDAFRGSALANLASTVAGVPAAWLGMLALELIVLSPLAAASQRFHWTLRGPVAQAIWLLFAAAWLGPADAPQIPLMIAAAAAVLLVPTFFVAVWLERPICLKAWPAADRETIRRAVFKANLVSYGLLLLLASGWIGYMLVTGAARATS